VPAMVGAAPSTAYDEIDLAVPLRAPIVQGVAQVRQRLLLREGGTVRELWRLDLGQGVDLLAPTLGESFARGATSVGPVRAAGTVRVDPLRARVTRISAMASVDD